MIKTIEESKLFKYGAWACVVVFAAGTMMLAVKLNTVSDALATSASNTTANLQAQ